MTSPSRFDWMFLQVDGGLTFLPLVAIPLTFLTIAGILLAIGGWIKSSRGALAPAMATALGVGVTLLVTAALPLVISIRPLEVALVVATATSLFPLGVALQNRDTRWTMGLLAVLAILIYLVVDVFTYTFGEVVPLTLIGGSVYLGCGYWLSDPPAPK